MMKRFLRFLVLFMAVLLSACGNTGQVSSVIGQLGGGVVLEKYMEISVEGEDGAGEVRYQFNKDKLKEDYFGRVKVNTDAGASMKDMEAYSLFEMTVEMVAEECLRVSQWSGLSNGEIIHASALSDQAVSDEFQKYFGMPITFFERDIPVSGLTGGSAAEPESAASDVKDSLFGTLQAAIKEAEKEETGVQTGETEKEETGIRTEEVSETENITAEPESETTGEDSLFGTLPASSGETEKKETETRTDAAPDTESSTAEAESETTGEEEKLCGTWVMERLGYQFTFRDDMTGETNYNKGEQQTFTWAVGRKEIILNFNETGRMEYIPYNFDAEGGLTLFGQSVVPGTDLAENDTSEKDQNSAILMEKEIRGEWHVEGKEDVYYWLYDSDTSGYFPGNGYGQVVTWGIYDDKIWVEQNGKRLINSTYYYDREKERLVFPEEDTFWSRNVISDEERLEEKGLGDLYLLYRPTEIFVNTLQRYGDYPLKGSPSWETFACFDMDGKFWIKAIEIDTNEDVLVQTDLRQNVYQVCRYADAQAIICNDEGEDFLAVSYNGNSYERGGVGIIADFNGYYANRYICSGDEFLLQAYKAKGRWWFVVGEVQETYQSFQSYLRIRDCSGALVWEEDVSNWIKRYNMRWSGDIRNIHNITGAYANDDANMVLFSLSWGNLLLDVESGETYALEDSSLMTDGRYLYMKNRELDGKKVLYKVGNHTNLIRSLDPDLINGYVGEGLLLTEKENIVDTSGKLKFTIPNLVNMSIYNEGKVGVTVVNSVGNNYWGLMDTDGKYLFEPIPGTYMDLCPEMGRFHHKISLNEPIRGISVAFADDEGNYILSDAYVQKAFMTDGENWYWLMVDDDEQIRLEGPLQIYTE